MPEIEIIQSDILSNQTYRLELIRLHKTQDGKTETQEREVYFRPDSAAILLIDVERKTVLLTKQFRLPVHLHGRKDLLVEACAGVLDKGELPEHAIIREVEEETGYRVSEIRKIAEGFMTPASLTEYVYFFTGKYTPEMKVSKGGGKAEEGEDIQLLEIPASEAKELVLAGKIYDVKTIVLLQHAIIQNLI